MDHQKEKRRRQLRRRRHVRRLMVGTAERPRLSVFRSSKHIYAQLIDDLRGVTLVAASSLSPELREQVPYGGNIKAATAVGKRLAEVAKEKGILKAAFDRGHYRFHGRVKALADGAVAAGLKFRDETRKPKKVKAPPEKPAGKPAKAAAEKTKPTKGGEEKAAKAPKEKPPKEKGAREQAPKEQAPE
jgi:large subunit ribosomal protein L18